MPSVAPREQMPFWQDAVKTQANVIGALLMRELHTRYGRDNVGYLWLFLEPMMLASAVAALHAGSSTAYGSDIRGVPLAICGYCSFIMFRSIFTRAEAALEANMPLLYHRSVTVFDILASRALLDGAGTAAVFVLLISFAADFGLAGLPERPLHIMFGLLEMLWFSFALSMLCCSITHDNRLAARLVHPLTYLLMPISGAFYVLSWLPDPYQTWLSYFPMTLIFEQIRYGQFRNASDAFIDPLYVCTWCMILTFFGLLSLRIVRRHIHLH